ncbi:hypothetical protein BWQ92_00405 [Arthrobacter sp. QXT-31]|nr:hypothetical protein BWQ92_00405 [Arthrobacter sp. QXT-31]
MKLEGIDSSLDAARGKHFQVVISGKWDCSDARSVPWNEVALHCGKLVQFVRTGIDVQFADVIADRVVGEAGLQGSRSESKQAACADCRCRYSSTRQRSLGP